MLTEKEAIVRLQCKVANKDVKQDSNTAGPNNQGNKSLKPRP